MCNPELELHRQISTDKCAERLSPWIEPIHWQEEQYWPDVLD